MATGGGKNLIKLYTPHEWKSLFPSPEIVIDGDYIFTGESYYRISRSPVGKIDNSLIYGSNFYEVGASPIGKIEKGPDIIKVYGPNYYQFGAQPIFYVKGDKVYSEKEYGKFVSYPSAYIQTDKKTPPTATDNKNVDTGVFTNKGSSVENKTIEPTNIEFGPVGWFLLIIAVVGLTGIGFFTGYFGSLSGLFLIGAVVGSIISAFLYKELGFFTEIISMFITTVFVVGILILVSSYVTDIVRLKTLLPWSLWEIVLALFASVAGAVMASGVSLVCVLIVWILKRIVISIK